MLNTIKNLATPSQKLTEDVKTGALEMPDVSLHTGQFGIDTLNDITKGAVMGLKDIGNTIANVGSKGIDAITGSKYNADIKAHADKEIKNYEKGGTNFATGLGRYLAQTAVLAPIATPAGGAIGGMLAKPALSNIANMATQGAIYGGAPYSPQGGNLGNALLGAGAGGIFGGAASGLGSLAGKYIQNAQAFRGALNTADELSAAGITPLKPMPRDYGNPGWKKFWDNILDQVPLIATRGKRLGQAQQMEPMVNDFIKTIAKTSAIEDTSAGSIDNIILKNFQKAQNMFKQERTRLWDNIFTPDLNKYPVGIKVEKNLAKDLAADKYNINSTYKNVLNLVADESDDASVNTLRQIRQNIGNAIGQLEKQKISGNASEAEIANLMKLKSSIETKIENFFSHTDSAKLQQYHRAKSFEAGYQDVFNPKNSDILDAIKTQTDMNNFVQHLLIDSNKQNVTNSLGIIGSQGQSALQIKALQSAIEKSVDVEKGLLNPQIFLNSLKKMGGNQSIVFGDSYKALEGLSKLMSRAKASWDIVNNPSTGQKAAQMATTAAAAAGLGGSAVIGGLGPTLGIGIPLSLLAKISSNGPLKRLLTMSKGLNESSSPQLVNYLVQQVSNQIGRLATTGVISSKRVPPEEQP